MTREEQIRKAAYSGKNNLHAQPHPVPGVAEMVNEYFALCFKEGAEWADSHPQWYDAQGDIVPEYGREVIVIQRNGMICYGHRPNPKEYVVVEGKKCFAKTYDKNNWNKIQEEGFLFGVRAFAKSRCTYLTTDISEAKQYGEVVLQIEYNPLEHTGMNNYVDGCWQLRVYEPISLTNIRKED